MEHTASLLQLVAGRKELQPYTTSCVRFQHHVAKFYAFPHQQDRWFLVHSMRVLCSFPLKDDSELPCVQLEPLILHW